MEFGLRAVEIKQIANIIYSFPEVHQAIIFGSLAMRNYKNGSDVDIALKGKNITHEIVTEIKYRLNEEILLPFFFEVVDFNDLQNEDLIAHINQFGKVLFKKLTQQKHVY